MLVVGLIKAHRNSAIQDTIEVAREIKWPSELQQLIIGLHLLGGAERISEFDLAPLVRSSGALN
jgi:hypothetical protein